MIKCIEYNFIWLHTRKNALENRHSSSGFVIPQSGIMGGKVKGLCLRCIHKLDMREKQRRNEEKYEKYDVKKYCKSLWRRFAPAKEGGWERELPGGILCGD